VTGADGGTLPARLVVHGVAPTADPDWGDDPFRGAAIDAIATLGDGEIPMLTPSEKPNSSSERPANSWCAQAMNFQGPQARNSESSPPRHPRATPVHGKGPRLIAP
jgi:hypothetical protein